MSRQSVLITGCSAGGIGSELALAFQRAGLTVIVTARTISKIDPALTSLPHVDVVQLDVSSSESIIAAAKLVHDELDGRLDILVNNAAIQVPGPIAEIPIREAKQMFDANFWGVLETTQAFLPMLVRTKGVVVNNASVGGFMNMPFNGVYGASKAALKTIGETLRLELAPYQVRVVTLATGGVLTNIFANMQQLDLPAHSMYKKVESSARDVLNAKGRESMLMPADQYADRVVKDVLAGSSGILWRGGGAWFIRILVEYLPTFVVDWMLVRDLGLDRLP